MSPGPADHAASTAAAAMPRALPPSPRLALVLMGGGARTAWQVGVLQALASMLRLQKAAAGHFPFQVLVGTSAGALNAAFLASTAGAGLAAFDQLAGFWRRLRPTQVYRLPLPGWMRASRLLMAWRLWARARHEGAVLDTMPLVDTLHRAISLAGIESALAAGCLESVAVTASSYDSGVHWTFCHTAADGAHAPWQRPGRRAEFQPLSIEHLMASSAIPFLFPATPLWVDGHREYFGDGSMRQVSPLSPALHLGARRVLVLGVGQPQRAGLADAGPGPGAPGQPAARGPLSMGAIAGHVMASVFHDTLQADVERTQRQARSLDGLPPELAAAFPDRAVQVLAMQPSQSLDALARSHAHALPAGLRRLLGDAGGGAGALASYLLFEPDFVQALIALGEHDAYARKQELLAFLHAGAA